MRKLHFATGCSGIGGAELGFIRAGMVPRWCSEIDPFASSVLKIRHPEVPNLGDFTKLVENEEANNGGTIDLFCAGTPCQSFSRAGLRKGLADPRGQLAIDYIRICEHFRPSWVVWENVYCVLSSWTSPEPPSDLQEGQEWETEETNDFGEFVEALRELGYGIAYRVLDAQYWALAQTRKRIILVGYLGDWRRAAAVLFDSESLSVYSPPGGTKRKEIAARTGRSPSDGHIIRGNAFFRNEQSGPGVNDYISSDLCPTLNTKDVHAIAYNICFNDVNGVRSDRPNSGLYVTQPEVCGTLTTLENNIKIVQNKTIPRPLMAQAINTTMDSLNEQTTGWAVDGAQVRELTLIEWERLQGFPDGYTCIPWMKGSRYGTSFLTTFDKYGARLPSVETWCCPDSLRRKAIGNSMPVPIMEWLARRILLVESL